MKLLCAFFCNFFRNNVFLIKKSIFLYRLSTVISSIIKASFVVSLKPPVLEIIKAQPLLAASKLDLPKGSSHFDGTTAILTSLSFFKIKELFLKPKCCKFLCLKKNFCLGSSPITILDQSLYLSKIFKIALPKISYPFEELSLPTNEIIFFFFSKINLSF